MDTLSDIARATVTDRQSPIADSGRLQAVSGLASGGMQIIRFGALPRRRRETRAVPRSLDGADLPVP
jgi:hypothetical protein